MYNTLLTETEVEGLQSLKHIFMNNSLLFNLAIFFHRKKVIKDKHNTYSLMAIFSECLEDTEDML